ncbi:MAG: hypothetical protein H0T64_02145 [Pyrinomonadaceae bacterium]|nr:hypothetical protein [Pyrinomonadaceae bacterium]
MFDAPEWPPRDARRAAVLIPIRMPDELALFPGPLRGLNDIVLPCGGCNPEPAQGLSPGQVIEDFLHLCIVQRL